ncbi:ABC transporter permease [Candidatus Saccharibacteria bacterium]|nr:ABC transporter permease [Candidatus Saccharibacteria bacterium]
MKLTDIIITANHNLFRSKTRTILTIIAIFIGSFTIILSNAINSGVNDFIDKQIESAGGDGYLEIMPTAVTENAVMALSGNGAVEYKETGNAPSEQPYITNEQIEKVRAIDGVESFDVLHTTTVDYITSNKIDKKYKLFNLNLVPRGNVNLDVTAGRKPDSESTNLEIALTEDLTKTLGFENAEAAIGETVTLAIPNTIDCYTAATHSECQRQVTATVVGVQAPGVMASGGPRANLALFEKVHELASDGMSQETKSQAYQATAQVDPARVDEIKAKLKDIGLTAMTIDDQVGMIRTFFDAILVVFNIFGGIALLAAAIGIINTLFMSVQERTREIGLEKALGMSSGKIFLSFSTEAILLGFWGSVLGIALSMLIGFGLNALAHATFLADLPTFNIVVFNPINMLIIALIIMLIAFIAGTAPAIRAAKKDPINSLRYE